MFHYKQFYKNLYEEVWKLFCVKYGQQYMLLNSTIKQTLDRFHTPHASGRIVSNGRFQLITSQ